MKPLATLRTAALIAIAIGAVGAVGLMLSAGRDAPRLLQVLMGGWVASPFAALAFADAMSPRWPARVRAAIHRVALAVTPATLAVYGAIASDPTRTQTPFFVMVPPASWLVIALAVAIPALADKRRG